LIFLKKLSIINIIRSVIVLETAKILPPTQHEIETARQELYAKLESADKQPMSEKRSAEEVFAEKREMLEELLNARVSRV
jgi:hypothetical protein